MSISSSIPLSSLPFWRASTDLLRFLSRRVSFRTDPSVRRSSFSPSGFASQEEERECLNYHSLSTSFRLLSSCIPLYLHNGTYHSSHFTVFPSIFLTLVLRSSFCLLHSWNLPCIRFAWNSIVSFSFLGRLELRAGKVGKGDARREERKIASPMTTSLSRSSTAAVSYTKLKFTFELVRSRPN